MDDAANDAVTFHLTQLLDEHLLRDAGYRPLQLRETQHVAAEEPEQDQKLPPALQELERFFDVIRGRLRRRRTPLTLG